jgi:hypothetical protein
MKKSKSKNEMSIWAITAHSESGDDYGVFLFDKKPTDDQLEYWLRELCPGEWEDADSEDEDHGPGFRGSYLHIDVSETSVIKL